jgi:hypothetical protein
MYQKNLILFSQIYLLVVQFIWRAPNFYAVESYFLAYFIMLSPMECKMKKTTIYKNLLVTN